MNPRTLIIVGAGMHTSAITRAMTENNPGIIVKVAANMEEVNAIKSTSRRSGRTEELSKNLMADQEEFEVVKFQHLPPDKIKYARKETAETQAKLKRKLDIQKQADRNEVNRTKVLSHKGLVVFTYGMRTVMALNQKNADKKARKLGYIK